MTSGRLCCQILKFTSCVASQCVIISVYDIVQNVGPKQNKENHDFVSEELVLSVQCLQDRMDEGD